MEKDVMFIVLFLFNFVSIQAVTFYPYSTGTNDLTLPRVDDAFTTVNLTFDLPFFGQLFRQVHVSTNGLIYFGRGSTQYVPSRFPLNDTKCVAAYWVDSDPRMGGDIFYREVYDPDLLSKITDEIKTKFVSHSTFRSSWAFVVTFSNVSRFGCSGSLVHPCEMVVNHQTILTSNGIDSFVVFLYDTLGYAYAQIGFNAGDGKRFFLVPFSNTANISSYAIEESNVGQPGKWLFSISSEISSACGSSGLLAIYPKKVLYYGGEEISITGPCFETNETSIGVMFGGISINCAIVDKLKVTCISPYIDVSGRISISLQYENTVYTSFINSYDESDELVKSSELRVTQANIDGSFNVNWNIPLNARSNNILISGAQEDITIDTNGNVIEVNRHRISLTVPNTGSYLYLPIPVASSNYEIIRKFSLYVKEMVFRSVVTLNPRRYTCDNWYSRQPNEQEMERIKDRESRRNPCQPSVPSNFPSTLPGNFERDEACSPNSPRMCNLFHYGAKGCYRSTNNPNNVATQCCYNSDNQLLIGPPGGGTLDMYDSNKSKLRHFMEDVLPYILCCTIQEKCDKYYEKRPSIDSRFFVPPVVRRANGDPHFVTIDGTSYDFNPIGEYIYLQAPDLTVQARMTQYADSFGILKQATYFSAFVIHSFSEIVQIELTSVKTIHVKVGNDTLYSGRWSFVNTSVDFINNSFVSVETSQGFKIEIQVLSGMFHAVVMLDQHLKGNIFGLVGNWDDDTDNDFMLPNKTFLPMNSSNSDIHYKFGMVWKTSASTSLFSYPTGLSWSDYQNDNFVPFFDVPQNDARCNGDRDCLFDLHVTGNLGVALSNIEVKEKAESIHDTYTKISETCILNVNVSNGRVDLVYNVSDPTNVVYHISCNQGYKLSGVATVTCVKGHNSDNFGSCREEQKQVPSGSTGQKPELKFMMVAIVVVFMKIVSLF